MKATKILLLLFVINSICISQVTQEWIQKYNLPVYDNLKFDFDRQGNIYAACQTDSDTTSGFNLDFIVIKYNSSGVEQWVKKYDSGCIYDNFSDIEVDKDGNIYLSGYTACGIPLSNNYVTIKYNSSGVQQWVNIFGSPGNGDDRASIIIVDNSGNVYVSGNSGNAICTIKLNMSGLLMWMKFYKRNAIASSARDIRIDNQGNVILAAMWSPFETTSYTIVKYNTSGDSLWETEDFSMYSPFKINVDNLNNIYALTGSGYLGMQTKSFIAKYNSNGVQQWKTEYSEAYTPMCMNDFVVDNSGNTYLTGYIGYTPPQYQNPQYLTLKYNSSGILQWARKYNYCSISGYASSVCKDNYGNIYVTGDSRCTNTGYDFATIKYNTAGDSIWSVRYNSSGNIDDEASIVRVDSLGKVYVGGTSAFLGNLKAITFIKYNQPVGVQPISSSIPKNFYLYQNYPNPFNPTTKIKFSLPNPSEGGEQDVRLIIYDVLGNEIATLVNQRFKPGTFEVEWDGSNYSSGIYFYKLQTADYTETKRMVLIK